MLRNLAASFPTIALITELLWMPDEQKPFGRSASIEYVRTRVGLTSLRGARSLSQRQCLSLLRLLKNLGFEDNKFFKELCNDHGLVPSIRMCKGKQNGPRELQERLAKYLGLVAYTESLYPPEPTVIMVRDDTVSPPNSFKEKIKIPLPVAPMTSLSGHLRRDSSESHSTTVSHADGDNSRDDDIHHRRRELDRRQLELELDRREMELELDRRELKLQRRQRELDRREGELDSIKSETAGSSPLNEVSETTASNE